MSSLSDQLKSIKDNSASVSLDRKSRSKIHSRSLIFESKVAAGQDYDYLYQVGVEGLDELTEIDTRFRKFFNTLFAETTINFDRNVQSKEMVEELDKNINAFFTLLGPYYLINSSAKAAEWIIRRFHANIHNAEIMLLSALPYYKHRIFIQILNVIPKSQLPEIFSWSAGYKDLLKSPTNQSLLKAFYNNSEFFKLYTMYFMDQLKNQTIHKEQLVFYLANAAQVTVAFSKNVERFNDLHMALLLELIGLSLIQVKKMGKGIKSISHDLILMVYSLIAVMASVIPLTESLIKSLTASIIEVQDVWSEDMRKKTLILLGQLWDCYSGEDFVLDELKDLAATNLTNDNLLETLSKEKFDLSKFLIAYFVSSPIATSIKVIKHIDLQNEYNFKVISNRLINGTVKEGSLNQDLLAEAFDHLLKLDEKLLIDTLANHNLQLSQLELLLSTTLSGNESNNYADIELEEDGETFSLEEGVANENVPNNVDFKKTSVESFFNCSIDDHNSLLKSLLSVVKGLNVKQQMKMISKFSKEVFPNPESSLSFILRSSLSHNVPLSIRLNMIRFFNLRLKEISKTSASFYLLVPIILLALNDKYREVRIAFSTVMRTVETIVKKDAEVKGKKSDHYLFMEDQIYSGIPAKEKSIIAPADALYLMEQIYSSNVIEDLTVDRSRINKLLFDVIFTSSKPGQKKIGTLKFKTFILNQWSINHWPLCLKVKAWDILASGHQIGEEEREFFHTDVEHFFKNSDSWIEEAKLYKIDFDTQVQKSLIKLVGGKSSNDKKVYHDVELLLSSFESTNRKLPQDASSRLQEIFPTIKQLDAKTKIVNKYIELIVDEKEVDVDLFDALQSLDIDGIVASELLSTVQIVSHMPEPGTLKRRRKSSNSSRQAMAKQEITNMAAVHLKKLTIVLEILEQKYRADNVKIASFDILQKYFKILTDLDYLGNEGNFSVLYAQEVLASCISLCIQEIKSQNIEIKLDSSTIRADLVVNSIRSSNSPQVQNKLLLVIAELASLSPELILHSVMSIFIFMGAHTVRQDDAFSSSVIDQTISKIIPALAESGSKSFNKEVEYLLTSFASAFPFIPRHRRVKLFTSLVDTLKPENSLHLVLFLMSISYANSLNKNKVSEANTVVEIISTLWNSFSAVEQIESISKFQQLWDRIPSQQLDTNSEEYSVLSQRPIFLELLALNEKELAEQKNYLLKFIDLLTKSDSRSFYNTPSLKIKVSLILSDTNNSDKEKSSILNSFRAIASHLLSALDKFSNESKDDVLTHSLYSLLSDILGLLPLNYLVDSVLNSMNIENFSDHFSTKIARNFAVLIGNKFEIETNESHLNEIVSDSTLTKLLNILLQGIKKNLTVDLEQAYLDTFAIVISKINFAQSDISSQILTDTLEVITKDIGLSNSNPEILISTINVITNIVSKLGVKSIGFFPKIVPPALQVWDKTREGDNESAELIQTGVLVLFSSLIKKIPAFMTTSLDSILMAVLNSDKVPNEIKSSIINVIVVHIDGASLFKSLCEIWSKKKLYEVQNPEALGLYVSCMQSTIEKLDKRSASSQSTLFMKWLILAFEFRQLAEESENGFDINTIQRLESSFHTCGINYVMKLNDKNFRPLFAALTRWAVDGEGSSSSSNSESSRLVSFFRFFNKLQTQLQGIITPYYSYILEPTASILKRFASGELVDVNLRRIILNSLTSSFKHDQDDFWTQQSRFDIIHDPLVDQLNNIEPSIGKYFVKTITSFIMNVSSDEHNEIMVQGLIKYISNSNESTSSNSKIWSIRTMKLVFQRMGDQWLSYLPTFIPFIAELLEDDDEAVELEVRSGLVGVIENVLGEPLDRYLD